MPGAPANSISPFTVNNAKWYDRIPSAEARNGSIKTSIMEEADPCVLRSGGLEAVCIDAQPLQQDVSHQVFLGTIYNILSTISLMAMGTCAKLAEEYGLPVMEVVLARSLALFVIPAVTAFSQDQDLRGNRIWLLIFRGVCGTLAISLWYSALALLPLTDVVVLGFLTPLFVALGSFLVLKEHCSRVVFLMTPVCFVGVIFSVQPTLIFGGQQRLNTLGVCLAILQAAAAAAVKLAIRELRTSESSAVIIFAAGLFSTLISCTACALIPGQFILPRSWQHVALLVATGICAYLYQLTMTLGMRRIKAAPAAAMAYLTVVWGSASGFVIFGEIPNAFSVLGTLVICIGTIAVAVDSCPTSVRQMFHSYVQCACSPPQRRSSFDGKGASLDLTGSEEGMEEERTAFVTTHRSVELTRPSL